MYEIRIHGRGGQGAVTAAELIAVAAFYDKHYSQAFPSFGVERRGAPVESYARISDEFIQLRSQVYEPDFILIQDDTLLGGTDVFKGIKKDTLVIINTQKSLKELIGLPAGIKVKTVEATKIARKILGKPIVNTVMLGAFAKATGLVKLKSLERVIGERFSGDLREKNIKAIRQAYQLTK